MPGTVTLVAEVTHVSKHGFWLLLGAEELLVPFEHFPGFKQATIAQRPGRAVAYAKSPVLAPARCGSLGRVHP